MELRRKATARAAFIGKGLKAHRVSAGMSQADVYNRTGVNPATITRIETGKGIPQRRTLDSLLATYGVRGAERERLVALAAKANEPAWLDNFANDVTDRYANLISWEADAVEAEEFETSLVPGLLQTEEYARAVIAGTTIPQLDPAGVERLVEVRRRRQQVLAKDSPLKLIAVIDEAVLHRPVGGPAVMAAQLTALAKENRPHVTIQVLPFGGDPHPGLLGSFRIMDDLTGSALVAIELALSNVLLDEVEEVRRYATMFETLRSRALSPEKSAAMFTAAARKIRR